ncbi:hypothetical protein [Nocardia pseudovaccinii]|uniref:hypothetical protein n=1 Tax=Nocardia pseudovaccinii TaxID=189540 RepID=UPI0007A4BF04|nr:hypothetical protein [Nocardia pseudovaccinii]
MLCGISDYITAHACWLDAYPVIGPAGAVFVVPSQRHIYAHPVANLQVVQATTVLAQVAALDYTQRPWPVSQDVYWWHGGTIELAAATQHTGESLCIYPSDDFLAALNELPEPRRDLRHTVVPLASRPSRFGLLDRLMRSWLSIEKEMTMPVLFIRYEVAPRGSDGSPR